MSASGLRVVQISNIFSGFLITVSPVKSNGLIPKIVNIFGHALNLAFLILFITVWLAYFEIEHKTLSITIQFFLHVPSYTGILFKAFYLQWNRKTVISIFRQTKNIFSKPKFKIYQKIIFQKVYFRSLIYLIFPMIIIIIVQSVSIFHYLSIFLKYTTYTEHEQGTDRFFEQSKIFSKLSPVYFCFNTIVATLFGWKGVTLDALVLVLYCTIGEALNILKYNLHAAVLGNSKHGSEEVDLVSWLQQQQVLVGLFSKLNALTSPWIVVAISFNSCTICVAAFAITKVLASSSFVMFLCGICVFVLLQTFLYCEAAHFLRKEGQGVSEAVYRSPWLQANSSLIPGLHLIALDCKRSFVVRGGAFFNLSLEFFVSIVGVVLTYLIVLLQLKDN